MRKCDTPLRIGFGTDLHPFKPGDGIWLGGVHIPCPYASKSISDGDVVLHALIDALLGACGLGDIGDHFPESDATRGIASSKLVEQALELIAEKGAVVVNVDCVIDLESVMLARVKGNIRESIASLLHISPGRVNVKAKTAEKLGWIGEDRAVGAQVAVLLAVGVD